MENPFDIFDRTPGRAAASPGNPFDRFDATPAVPTLPRAAAPGPFDGVMTPDHAEIAAGAPAVPEPGLGASVVKALPRGAIETAATGLEPLALSRRIVQGQIRSFGERVRGAAALPVEEWRKLLGDIARSDMPMAAKGRIINAAKDVRQRRTAPAAVPDFAAEIEGNPPETAARAMQGFAEEAFPIPPEHEKRLPVQVARGVGSTAAYLGTRLLPGGQALLPLTAGAIGSGEAIERAAANGATDERQAKAGLMGVAPGLTDIVPIERLLRPVAHIPGVKGALYGVARKAVEQGAIEGTQEAVQQFLQNAIARVTHMPGQAITQGIADNGLVGFLVGVLFGGGAGTVQAARQASPAPSPEIGQEQNPFDAFGEQETAPPETPTAPPPVEPKPGRKGDLGGKVPMTQAQLEGMLNRADAARHAPNVPKEIKEQARQLQQETVSELDVALARVLATDYGRTWQANFNAAIKRGRSERKAAAEADAATEGASADPVEITLNTARGRQTRFTLPAKPGAIGRLRERLAKKVSAGLFAAVDLDAAAGAVDQARAAGIETAGRPIEDITDDLADRARPDSELAPEIVPRQGPTVEAMPARVELYDEAGTIMTLPTGRPLDEARPLAENVARARGTEIGWRYVDNETNEVVHDSSGDVMGDVSEAQAGTYASAEPGVNYTGMVSDTVEGNEAPANDPLRREDILRPLLKALDVPLYQGRMKGRKILGFYRRGIEETRIKRMNDIEVAAHELAHMLDDRIPEIRRQWNPATKANKTIRDELRGVSYDQSKLFEGFAEFVRLWSTQKEQARAKAPNFFAWFEDFLSRSEDGPALRKAQDEMHAWFAQDAVSRARSKIGEVEDINAGLTSVWERLRQSIVDDLHGILRMEKDLTGDISPVGAYETARLTRAKHSMIEGTLLYGAPVVNPDGSHRFEGKGLQEILDPVAGRIDDFTMYAVGRAAGELAGQGRERLFTPAEIKGMLALETPEFKTAFDEYQHWNDAILDFAQAKGVINPAARARWRRNNYLPFHRVGQPGAFTPVPGDWKGIKTLTGGTDNLRPILGNMIGNAAMLMDAALTNEARLKVAGLSQIRGGAKFMAKIPTEERRLKVHREEIERAILEALGVKKRAQLPPDARQMLDQIAAGMDLFVPLTQRGQTPLGGNVVAVLNHGKPEYYEVADPLLFRSLTHLNRPTKNWLVRALSVPRRIGQASITLSFDFMAANFARDTLMGAVMSRHGFKPLIDSARGLKSRLTTDRNYRDFIANGGGFASYLVDEDAFRTHLDQFYTGRGIDPGMVLDSPRKLLLGLERIADAFEMSTRLGEFRKASEGGAHPRHAAYSAREVSTDFAMRGDSAVLGFFYDTIMFLKAGMNGIDRFYRGVVYDKNRMHIAAKTGIIAMLSMGLYAINRDNPLYDDLEDWDRDTHWHFFIPTAETIEAEAGGRELPPIGERYTHFRYPKIWEIGAIASIAERGLEGALEGQPAEFAKDTARIVRDTFRFEYLPQAVAPLAEQAMNRIRFVDRPIETQAMKEVAPWARAGAYTSSALRKAGEATRDLPEALQLNPVRTEAFLRGYLNTWAVYGLSMADAAFEDDKPDMRTDQYPVVRRFFRREPARSSRHLKELYDAIDAATQARRTMRLMDKTYRPDIAGELEHAPENLEYGQLTRADQRLRAINSEIRKVINTPSLALVRDLAEDRSRLPGHRGLVDRAEAKGVWHDAGKLKRFLIDDLTTERNLYAKKVMADVHARRQKKAGGR